MIQKKERYEFNSWEEYNKYLVGLNKPKSTKTRAKPTKQKGE